MAIITKPAGGIVKGVSASISLSKSELSALSIIVADSYFSNTSNWNKVILKYRSSTGKQYEAVQFDATLSSPTGNFLVSIKARNAFEIQTIEIHDFDNDIFIVPRSALTTADFDIVLLTAPSSLSYSTPVTYTQNTAITNNVPTVTGTVTSYSILPALPTGLTLNTTTGVISGTPTEASAAANYVVTASNGAGSTTATINITVESAEVPVGDPILWQSKPGYIIEADGGATATSERPSYGEFYRVLAPSSQWVTGDFTFEAEINNAWVHNDFIGFYSSDTDFSVTTGFSGSVIRYEQSVPASYVKPAGDTYTLKMQRIGYVIKFYVNDVEVYSATQTNLSTVKVPFFTFTNSTKHIVSATLIIPEATINYLTYELNTAGATLNATGGVSGGNAGDDFYAKDSSGASGDFAYEWKFNWSSINPFNVLFGVIGTYGSGLWYEKLTCLEGVNGTNPEKARLWVNGAQNVLTNITIPDGDNVYKLTRSGTVISHYLNGSLIYSSSVSLFTAYPTVRTKGLSACIESYIPQASEFTSTYIDWTERAGYTTQVDGGLTSTVTTNFNWDWSTLIYADNSVKNPSTGEFSIVYKLNKQDFNTSDFRFLGYTDLGKTKVGGFYKDNNVASNRIRLLAESLPLGSDIDLSAIYSNSNITTLELKITINSNSTKFFVNGILYGTRTGSFTGNTTGIIPTARVISGMELLESSIIDPVAQPVTWNVAGKTGTGTVTTGADGLITKATGGNGYNVNVLSNEVTTGDGYIQFVYSSIFLNTVFGFGEINSSTGSFNQIIYGTYVAGPNSYETVVNGILTGNTGVTVASGDVVRIQRTGTTFSILRNGSVINTVTINNTNPLKASISIFAQTYGVNNVTLSE